MSERKPYYIEEKLFYRFFQAAYRYLKLNLYFSMFNGFFFLLSTFSTLRGDTLLVFFLATLTIGPSLMSLMEDQQRFLKKGELPSLRSFAKSFKQFFRPGILFSLLLSANFFWFWIMLLFLQQNQLGLFMLPLFFTLGSITFATSVNAMVGIVNGIFSRVGAALKEAFFLSIKNLLVTYYHSVLAIALVYVMYYRPILGFLILTSMVITYLYYLSRNLVLKISDGGNEIEKR